MFHKRSHKPTLGLYHDDTGCHVVQLHRDAGRWRVAHAHAADLDAPANAPRAFASLLDRLDPRARQGAVGLAIEGSHGLYRRIDAPPVGPAETARIIAAQVETMIPGQLDQVRWGWLRHEPADPAIVFTATRRQLDAAAQTLTGHCSVNAVLPQPFALDALIQAGADDAATARPEQLAVLAIYPQHTHLLVYRGRAPVLIQTIDGSPGDESDHRRWAERVTEHYRQATHTLRDDERPTAMLCLSSRAVPPAAAAALSQHVGLPPAAWGDVCPMAGLAEPDLGVLVAAGAAIAAAKPDAPRNLLADTTSGGEAGPAVAMPSRRAWLSVALWLVAALALLYVIDLRSANQYQQAVQASGLNEKQLAELDRNLALARYLETLGPTFLSILDEISQKTEGFLIDEVRYERDGQITIRGKQGSPDAISKFAQDMAALRTVESVQVRNQQAEGNNGFSYTLVAKPSMRFFGGFVEPPPAKDDQPPDAALAAKKEKTADARR